MAGNEELILKMIVCLLCDDFKGVDLAEIEER